MLLLASEDGEIEKLIRQKHMSVNIFNHQKQHQSNFNMALNQLLQELNQQQIKTAQLTSSLRIIKNRVTTIESEHLQIENESNLIRTSCFAHQQTEFDAKTTTQDIESEIAKAKELLESERAMHLTFAKDILTLREELESFDQEVDSSPLKLFSKNFKNYFSSSFRGNGIPGDDVYPVNEVNDTKSCVGENDDGECCNIFLFF